MDAFLRARKLDPTGSNPVVHAFPVGERVTTTALHQVLEKALVAGTRHVIIIYDDDVTKTAALRKVKFFDELMRIETLSYNFLDRFDPPHELVPPHTPLTSEELDEFRTFFPLDKIPRIFASDPVCRYYGFQPGQVLRIIRRNSGVPYYRLVVPTP